MPERSVTLSQRRRLRAAVRDLGAEARELTAQARYLDDRVATLQQAVVLMAAIVNEVAGPPGEGEGR